MEHEAVGGILDSLIKKYLTDALANASFDYKKFLGHAKTKEAAQALAVSLKASASLPFDLDDKAIDYALIALSELLDQYKNLGPVKVGAAEPVPMEARKRRSREEVEAELRKVGINPLTIGSIIMLILQYAPDLVALIKKLFGK